VFWVDKWLNGKKMDDTSEDGWYFSEISLLSFPNERSNLWRFVMGSRR
jgi:hypothetical protein